MTIRAQNHQVFDFAITSLLRAVHGVLELGLAFLWNFQTDGERLASGCTSIRLFFGKIAIGVAAMIHTFVCIRTSAIGNLLFHVRIGAVFLGREITIGFALFDEAIRGRAVLIGIVGLKNQFLVMVQPEPFEPFENRARRFLGRTLKVGVLYT